jgi:hypothetical protein
MSLPDLMEATEVAEKKYRSKISLPLKLPWET